jgi:tetratricopeptide (TPR) repeat protein
MSLTLITAMTSLRVLVGVAGVSYSIFANRDENGNFISGEIPKAIFGQAVGGVFYDWLKTGTSAGYDRFLQNLDSLDADALNHDLQRAAGKATLLATFFACQGCLAEIKSERQSIWKRLKNIAWKDEDVNWLVAVSKSLKDEIKTVETATFDDRIDYRELFSIFDRENIAGTKQAQNNFAGKLKEETLKDIKNSSYAKFGGQISVPFSQNAFDLLSDAIYSGWEQFAEDKDFTIQLKLTAAGSRVKKYDWFKLLCVVFNEEYKVNEKIEAAMQKQIALGQTALLEQISHDLQSFGRIENFNDLERRISDFREESLESHRTTHEKQDKAQEGIDELKETGNRLIKVSAEIKELQEKQAIEREKEIEEKFRRQQSLAKTGTVVGKFIFVRPTRFFNRDSEFALLKRHILENQTPLIFIKGAGGFGKTSLAEHFLKEIAPNGKIGDSRVNEIVVFNGQTGEIEFEKIFSRAADLLERVAAAPDGQSPLRDIFRVQMPDEQRIAMLFDHLRELGKVWFFFDNFESVLTEENKLKDERLLRFLELALQQDADLRLILTTREIPVFEGAQRISPVNMQGQLPPSDAINYLKQLAQDYHINWRVPAEEIDDLLAQLAEKLRYIPKALFSFAEYFKQDREKPLVLQKVLENETLFADFQAYDYESGYAHLIGEQFAVLSSLEQAVWKVLSVFREPVSSEAIKYILAGYQLDEVWRLLHGSGLIVVEERLIDGDPNFLYSLEQSAQDYVYQSLPKEAIEENEESKLFNCRILHQQAAAFYYSIRKPVAECYTREDFAAYFSTIDHLTTAGNGDLAIDLFNEIILKLIALGYMNEIIGRSRLLVGKLGESSIEANNFCNLGLALQNLGKLNEAIAEYDKAIQIYQPLVESGSAELASDLVNAYGNKGIALRNLGRLDEAIAEFDKATEIRKPLVEAGRIELANDLAKDYLNKGNVFINLGKLDEAIVEYDKAIQIRQPLVEAGHVELATDLAIAYINKGVALRHLGKLDEAIAEYDKAIQIYQPLVESGRVELVNDLAKAYVNKGSALDSLGRFNEAIVEYDKAIQIRQPLVESGRVELADNLAKAYVNKGSALDGLGKFNEAVDIYGAAIKLWEDIAGLHILPNLVKALRIRVKVLIKLEDWEKTAIDVGKAFTVDFHILQSDEVSDHFKQLIGGEIGIIIRLLSELPAKKREEIYKCAGENGEVIKQLVEDFEKDEKNLDIRA